MAELFAAEKVPETVSGKKDLLSENRIALWDSIRSCDIEGSDDSSIRNVVPNDLGVIFAFADITAVFTNGRRSHEINTRYCIEKTGMKDVCLPSTSPANAQWSMDRLIAAWSVVKEAAGH